MKPIEWQRMIAAANHPYTLGEQSALWSLASFLGADGRGFASIRQIAQRAKVQERTVKYATAKARKRGHLEQTRRGHRIRNGLAVASEWQLIDPTQGERGVTLGRKPRGTGVHVGPKAKGQKSRPKGQRGAPPEVLLPETPSSMHASTGSSEMDGMHADDDRRPCACRHADDGTLVRACAKHRKKEDDR